MIVIVILIVLVLAAALVCLFSDKVKDLFHFGGKKGGYNIHKEPMRMDKKDLTDLRGACRTPRKRK